jgi:hypothetical protein
MTVGPSAPAFYKCNSWPTVDVSRLVDSLLIGLHPAGRFQTGLDRGERLGYEGTLTSPPSPQRQQGMLVKEKERERWQA